MTAANNASGLAWKTASTPDDTHYGTRAYDLCINPECIESYMDNLFTAQRAGTHPMNAVVTAGANFTDSCGVAVPAAFAAGKAGYDALAANFTIAPGVTAGMMSAQYAGMIANVAAHLAATTAAEASARAKHAAAVDAAAAAAALAAITTTAGPEPIKVAASLTVGFTVPANATAASLNSDATFKTALAATIKASLTLPTGASVTITQIAAAARARVLTAMKRRLNTLDLKVDYEITGIFNEEFFGAFRFLFEIVVGSEILGLKSEVNQCEYVKMTY